jgi:hypothetical protein
MVGPRSARPAGRIATSAAIAAASGGIALVGVAGVSGSVGAVTTGAHSPLQRAHRTVRPTVSNESGTS